MFFSSFHLRGFGGETQINMATYFYVHLLVDFPTERVGMVAYSKLFSWNRHYSTLAAGGQIPAVSSKGFLF